MKFVWRYIWRKMRDIGNEPEAIADRGLVGAKYATVSRADDSDWGDGLNIKVHSAQGGRIVTFYRYDRQKDRSNNTVYIIPDDQDFERELGKLITLEAMRG